MIDLNAANIKPCLDCKPKPQKCFRCGVVNSDETVISCYSTYRDGTDATNGGSIGRHRYVDQRKWQQREDHRWLMWGDEGQYYVVEWKDDKPWRIAKDNRNGDRRD